MSATMVNLLATIGPFVLMFVVFYFILIRPENKRKKRYEEMLNELKVNEKIITRGGIVGRIIKINDETLVIESSSDRTKIEVTRQGVSSKVEN